MNNLLLRKGFRIVIATLSTIFIIILIWIMLDCFPRDVIIEEKVLSYESESTLNYIGSKEDNAVLKYYYLFKADKDVNSIYKYHVVATIRATEDGDTIVKKEVNVVDSIEESLDDTNIVKINIEVNLPLNYIYDELFGNLNGNKENIYLDIEFITDNNITLDKDDPEYIDVSSKNKITFPLSESYKNKNDKQFTRKSIGVSHRERASFNSYLFMLSMLCFVAIIPVTILSYVSLFNLSNYDEYKRKLNSIKKKYNDFIITRKKVPSFKKKEIIEEMVFENLLEHIDDEEIVFFDKSPGKESWFYLEKKKEVYLYILRLDHDLIFMNDNTVIKRPKKHKK